MSNLFANLMIGIREIAIISLIIPSMGLATGNCVKRR